MNLPERIIKRDGRTVPFDADRIKRSIGKAMIAKNKFDEKLLEDILNDVRSRVSEVFKDKTPSVEEVQDIIEVELMKNNLYDVAKAYILYRHKKSEVREEKKKILNKEKLDEVDKSFSINSLKLLAARYLIKDKEGMPAESPKQLFQRVAVAMAIPEILHDERVHDKDGKSEINCSTEKYENLDEFDCKYALNGWEINKWHFERMVALYKELTAERKMKVGFDVILDMLERGEFKAAEEIAKKAYNFMTRRDFLPNTPTLVNAGRRLGMLSACFTLDVEDNMESIMKLARDCAIIHKSGGGTGVNFSKIRPEGDIVASTTGVASGPVSFMKLIDAVSNVIKQGGVRRAANMGILEIWHPDIHTFINAKLQENTLENFNISVGVGSDFWDCYMNDSEYPLKHPATGEIVKNVNARKLFREIAYSAWEIADPGVLYLDNINKRNVMKKWRGEVKVTNPCGEEPLYPYESCNLASINLSNFVVVEEDGSAAFDWERFNSAVRFVARMLDNIISMNKYPLEIINKETKKTRRIGLGVMGLGDALYKLGIRYNSDEGFEFMKKVAEHLTYYAFEESAALAEERGPFKIYDKTDYPKGELPVEGYYRKGEWTLDWDALVEKIKRKKLRNAMVTTAPPTGSIGMIADASTGIEPVFSLAFEKRVTVGSFEYINQIFKDALKKRNAYSDELIKEVIENYGSVQGMDDEKVPKEIRDVFVTAMDIHWADHLMAQAVMQLWITDSISKTINMRSDASVEEVEQAYILAHRLGCKGITVYRDLSKKGQVLNINREEKLPNKPALSPYALSAIQQLSEDYEYINLDVVVGEINAAEQSEDANDEKCEMMAPIVKGIKAGSNMAQICPNCESMNIISESGCLSCLDCGWSACTSS